MINIMEGRVNTMIKMKMLLRDDRGQSTIIFAFALLALLGITALTMDVGAMFWQRRHLQNTADAAALAGAQELARGRGGPEILERIRSNVTANGLSDAAIVNREDIGDIDPITDIHVPVELSVSRDLTFARVLGFGAATIRARAEAAIGPVTVTQMTGLRPFAITERTFAAIPLGTHVLLHGKFKNDNDNKDEDTPIPGGGVGPGNWGVVEFPQDLGNSSINHHDIERWLEHGYGGLISVGQTLQTQPGAGLNTLRKRFDDLFDIGDVWIVPLVNVIKPEGRADVRVTRFLAVKVVGFASKGDDLTITVKTVDLIFFAGGNPNSIGPDPNVGFRPLGVTLVR